MEPRYEPLVSKSNHSILAPNTSSSNHDEDSSYLASLLNEVWTSKKPASNVHLSVLDYHEAYKSGRVTPTDVAKVLLPLIDRDAEVKGKHYKAFLQTRKDLVLEAAEESTRRFREGRWVSVLDGELRYEI